MEDDVFKRAVRDLDADGYLDALTESAWGGKILRVAIDRLMPKGLRAVGAWPSGTTGEEFIKALWQRAASETDPAEKTRLGKLADAAASVGQGVITALIVDVMRRAGL